MRLDIKVERWNEVTSEWLYPAMNDDPAYNLDDLKHDVESGDCTLCNVYNEKQEHIASFVLRLDHLSTDYAELVVVAAGGYLKGASLYAHITPWVIDVARKSGAKAIRGHTKRKGIGKLMEIAGWEQSEIIYRKRVQ